MIFCMNVFLKINFQKIISMLNLKVVLRPYNDLNKGVKLPTNGELLIKHQQNICSSFAMLNYDSFNMFNNK